MKEEDYDVLKIFLDKFVERIGKEKLSVIRQELNNEVKFRWFLLAGSRIKIGDGVGINGDINIYSYCNDTHIDTALRHYVDNSQALGQN